MVSGCIVRISCRSVPFAKAVLAIALAVTPTHSIAQEWSRFRGPNGTGISHAKTIPTAIGAADLLWKV